MIYFLSQSRMTVQLLSKEDEAEESEYTNEENTFAEPTNGSNIGVVYPKYSIKTKRHSVAISSLHLLRTLSNMLQSRLRFEEKQKSQQTDKKLQQKINDKKQAQGLH